LGAALFSALEKKDAEDLALLRSEHEMKLLDAVREVKEKQIDEAKNTYDGLVKYQDVVTARQRYYSSRPDRISEEDAHLGLLGTSISLQAIQIVLEILGSGLHYIPNLKAGGPATLGVTYGGDNVGPAVRAFGGALGTAASALNTGASIASTLGSYRRRRDDWDHQADLATRELQQIEKQIAAANIRIAIAEQELKNHETQIENAHAVDEYMRNKFTNFELYQWMIGQTSTIFFQSYQMAYDLAKKVERAYRFERGLTDSNFIKFGYWDSLRKGLLAGDQLHYDLKRLELAYLEQNKREYEITKHISFVLHDPLALIALKETGQCEVFLPEALFDADYSGHYMRRIKSVSITIPCVVGPYTSINCTLTLLSNKTRVNSIVGQSYGEQDGEEDNRFVTNFAAMQSIATSHAQNDSGVFELNFRDERYLPFEGAGVISRWRIEMPKENNAFDFNTLSDVVLHFKYTAREGGEILRRAAQKAIEETLADTENSSLARLFSAKHEFPTEWYRFLHPTESPATTQTLKLNLTKERFPFQFRAKTATIKNVLLLLKLKDGIEYEDATLAFHETGQPDSPKIEFKTASGAIIQLPVARPENLSGPVPQTLTLEVRESELPLGSASETTWWQTTKVGNETHTRLRPEAIEDIWIVCQYSVTSS
jgi:hypothetical protein